jgi:hypothetical protein
MTLSKTIAPQKKTPKKFPPQNPDTVHTERVELEHLLDAIEASGLSEFMEYIRSPWKMLWPNFVAGIARGF